LPKIEQLNHVEINEFGYDHSKPFVIYNDRERVEEKTILDLLTIKEGSINHCVWIKTFSRFVRPSGDTKCKRTFYMIEIVLASVGMQTQN